MTNNQSSNKNDSEEKSPTHQTNDEGLEIDLTYSKNRIRIGLTLIVIGYLLFLLGARPSLFGLDRSRVIGFVQISVFLIGLGIIILGSYLTIHTFWPEGKKTIAADIGSRLVSTGYVICVFTAMADIFGLGSHRLPDVFFGPLQARGMAIGMATIAIGFLLLIRYRRPELDNSSKEKNKKSNSNTDSKKTPHQVQLNPLNLS